MSQLLNYRWPGNVRELKNVIERAVVLCRGHKIVSPDLLLSKLATSGDTGQIDPNEKEFQPTSLNDIERDHIQATLEFTQWNKSRAASFLGIERSTLDRKIRRYDLANESRE